jgi:hypothetical protein
VIAGLDPVDQGDVYVAGRCVTGLPASKRRVAMVFEAPALTPFLDVAGNLGWGLRVQNVPDETVRRRVDDRARELRIRKLLPVPRGVLNRAVQPVTEPVTAPLARHRAMRPMCCSVSSGNQGSVTGCDGCPEPSQPVTGKRSETGCALVAAARGTRTAAPVRLASP